MLHPPGGVLCTLPAASFAALLFIFSREWTDTDLAYLVFFYLPILCLFCFVPLPGCWSISGSLCAAVSRSTKQFHGQKYSDSWPTLLIGAVSALAAA